VVENLNLVGVDRIFVCTAISPTTVYMMHCALRLKRSGTPISRMELVEVGPSMDLVVRRHRYPAQDLEKEAMKAPGHAKKVNPMGKCSLVIRYSYLDGYRLQTVSLNNSHLVHSSAH
jgi:ribosome production factor 2